MTRGEALILRWPFRAVYNDDIHRSLDCFQAQPELFLESSKDGWKLRVRLLGGSPFHLVIVLTFQAGVVRNRSAQYPAQGAGEPRCCCLRCSHTSGGCI